MRSEVEIIKEIADLVSLERKGTGESSLPSFVEIYLKSLQTHKAPPFHSEMMSLITDLEAGRINRLLFQAPRGFAKSTICSVFFPLWLGLYGKKQDIFIVSATISLAKELLRKIRNELENNPKLVEDFGEMKSDKWTEDMLVLKNGTVIRAKGRGFQIRGFRPDIIICDDLEDEEVLYSKEQRDKLQIWFNRTLLPALKPDQGLLYVGTKLHQYALIGKMAEKPEFTVRVYKALVDGKSIWEEMWKTERLLELKEQLGSYAFEAEYQNNPISLEDQPIKPHFIEGVKIGGEEIASCLSLDPAISEKESSDYRAITLFSKTTEGFREKYSENGRWGVEDQCERIIRLYEAYKPDRIVIEEVAFQKVLRTILMEKAKAKGIYLPISEAQLGRGDDKRPRDKMTRLLGVAHLFEQKKVEIVNPKLKEELLTFPEGEHDDLVDACVYALSWLNNYRSGALLMKKEKVGSPLQTKPALNLKEVRPGVWAAVPEEPEPNKKKHILKFR